MQPDLRVLLVDDEPLVRKGVRTALQAAAGLEIVGEATDGLHAIDEIERLQPDLVLLDVQMPGCDGFEVLGAIAPDERPAVVFVTAYEQYALRAFEEHAIDYLLKPFDDARLLSAIERARSWVGRRVDELLADVQSQRGRARFLVRHAGRVRVVAAHEVAWIEARGNYVHLHHADGPFLVRETLSSLADSLDDRRFVRVHRSAIVAVDEVEQLERLPSGSHELRLRNGARVPLGRSYRQAFENAWQRR